MFYFFIMKSFIFSLFVVLLFIYGVVSNIVYASINNKKSEEVLELYIDSYVINDIIDVSKYDDLEEKNKEKCILKILQKRKNLGDKNFNKKDAEILYEKISFYSKKHNINLKDGFIIVNVESDFNHRAFNRKGKAVGLTQITTPCLSEYNNLNRTKYELNQMFDIDLNLEVGFWYYNRLMKHYSKYSIYGINRFDKENALKDCYIAYNIGITEFKNVGNYGRNQLRNGFYPKDMYGSKKGDVYLPILRYLSVLKYWS